MRLLCELAILGALIFAGWQTPFHERLFTSKQSSPPTTQTHLSDEAAAEGDNIVLRQPTTVRLKYGSATLPAGLSLHIISKTSDAAVVDYAGEHVTIPLR